MLLLYNFQTGWGENLGIALDNRHSKKWRFVQEKNGYIKRKILTIIINNHKTVEPNDLIAQGAAQRWSWYCFPQSKASQHQSNRHYPEFSHSIIEITLYLQTIHTCTYFWEMRFSKLDMDVLSKDSNNRYILYPALNSINTSFTIYPSQHWRE